MIVSIKIKDEFYNIKFYEIQLVYHFCIKKDVIVLERFEGSNIEIGYNEIIEISCVG